MAATEPDSESNNRSEPCQTPLSPSFPPSLLLLSDSALPLGSFAFSSGLESYLAHHKSRPQSHHHHGIHKAATAPILPFLALSLAATASTSLPYLVETYRAPHRILDLDNALDASTPCTIARRASVAQGQALLGVWERSFRPATAPSSPAHPPPSGTSSASGTENPGPADPDPDASAALSALSAALKSPPSPSPSPSPPASAHLAPTFALVARALRLALPDAAHVFLFNHAKAVLSAAVRAGAMGPYAAQGVLAGSWLRAEIERGVESNWAVGVHEAGQVCPVVDLWGGRHGVVYSRIFMS